MVVVVSLRVKAKIQRRNWTKLMHLRQSIISVSKSQVEGKFKDIVVLFVTAFGGEMKGGRLLANAGADGNQRKRCVLRLLFRAQGCAFVFVSLADVAASLRGAEAPESVESS
jgi:hypothetical protein